MYFSLKRAMNSESVEASEFGVSVVRVDPQFHYAELLRRFCLDGKGLQRFVGRRWDLVFVFSEQHSLGVVFITEPVDGEVVGRRVDVVRGGEALRNVFVSEGGDRDFVGQLNDEESFAPAESPARTRMHFGLDYGPGGVVGIPHGKSQQRDHRRSGSVRLGASCRQDGSSGGFEGEVG